MPETDYCARDDRWYDAGSSPRDATRDRARQVSVRDMTDTKEAGLIEIIAANNCELAYVIRAAYQPTETKFLTPAELKQQVGYIVYPAGTEIPRHSHRALERQIVGTSEVLMIKSGCCLIDIYDDEKQFVATRELCVGDVVLLVAGGHGLRMLENTVLLEIKQGPYTGLDEKERF